MNRYGQTITWGTLSAPHLFTGKCTSYRASTRAQRQLVADEVGEYFAGILTGVKTDLGFDGKVTSGSTDFLDLSAGASITVAGISVGTVLASRAVETWRLSTPKTCTIAATHYPNVTQASPVAAGVALSAFTPDQSALTIVTPGATVIFGTYGMTHAAGTLHGLILEQQLTLKEDELTPDGLITGVAATGYMKTQKLEILAKSTQPVVGATLVVTGGPDHSVDFRIEASEKTFEDERGAMYSVEAFWIPPFSD